MLWHNNVSAIMCGRRWTAFWKASTVSFPIIYWVFLMKTNSNYCCAEQESIRLVIFASIILLMEIRQSSVKCSAGFGQQLVILVKLKWRACYNSQLAARSCPRAVSRNWILAFKLRPLPHLVIFRQLIRVSINCACLTTRATNISKKRSY